MTESLLGSPEAVRALAEKLATIEWIDREETPHDEPPSWTSTPSFRSQIDNAPPLQEP